MAHKRINFLRVPIDVVPEEELESVIMELSQKKQFSQICFVTIWDVLKARRNSEYLKCLENAALVIPVSKSILRGVSFLKLETPMRYNPFRAVISILNVIDKNFWTLYLLGGRRDPLLNADKNVHSTFPNIHIVGRFVGYYQKNYEPNIIEAIHKASPTLLLMSDGLSGGDLWSYRRREKFNNGMFLYYKDCFGIFSKRKHRVSYGTFDKGLEIWGDILRNPFKLFLIIPYMWYITVLIWYKITGKSKKQLAGYVDALEVNKENGEEKNTDL